MEVTSQRHPLSTMCKLLHVVRRPFPSDRNRRSRGVRACLQGLRLATAGLAEIAKAGAIGSGNDPERVLGMNPFWGVPLPSQQLTWKCTDPCRKTIFFLERAFCTSMLVGGRVAGWTVYSDHSIAHSVRTSKIGPGSSLESTICSLPPKTLPVTTNWRIDFQ